MDGSGTPGEKIVETKGKGKKGGGKGKGKGKGDQPQAPQTRHMVPTGLGIFVFLLVGLFFSGNNLQAPPITITATVVAVEIVVHQRLLRLCIFRGETRSSIYKMNNMSFFSIMFLAV